MGQFNDQNAKGVCANCGKEVSVRDIRQTTNYCNRICASMRRYKKRYVGINATRIPKQVIEDKMSKL